MDDKKIAKLFYPKSGRSESRFFDAGDLHAASSLYQYTILKDGQIVDLINFSQFEIDLLQNCRTPEGQCLFQTDKEE